MLQCETVKLHFSHRKAYTKLTRKGETNLHTHGKKKKEEKKGVGWGGGRKKVCIKKHIDPCLYNYICDTYGRKLSRVCIYPSHTTSLRSLFLLWYFTFLSSRRRPYQTKSSQNLCENRIVDSSAIIWASRTVCLNGLSNKGKVFPVVNPQHSKHKRYNYTNH